MPAPFRKQQKKIYFNPPELINRAASRAKSLIWRILRDYSAKRVYKLREDLRNTITIILQELVHATSLEHNGVIVDVDTQANCARPMLVGLLAHRCGIPQRTVERCLKILTDIGLLAKTSQKKARNGETLRVSAVHRYLTDKFWHAVKLLHNFKVECQKRSQNSKIKLLVPEYIIILARRALKSRMDGIFGGKPKTHHKQKPIQQQLEEMYALDRQWKEQALLQQASLI